VNSIRPQKAKRKRKLKKSKLQRSKENPNSSYWMRKCDATFGMIFHAEYKHCLIGCGCKGNIEMAHLIPRENYLYRWNENAVIPLCSWHHKYSRELSAHNAPIQFAIWLKEKYPIQFEWLENHQRVITRKAELPWTFQEKYLELLQVAKELNIEGV